MNYYNIFYVLALIGLISCDNPENWYAETDSIAPGIVTNAISTGTPGGAMILYDIPDDSDLLGVKAVYEGKDGNQKEVFSSAFKDTIEIVGFGDTIKRNVNLFAVDKSMNESEPVALSFIPKEPSIVYIEKSFVCKAVFGGVYLSWKNPTKDNIAIELWKKNSMGVSEYVETRYSDEADGKYSFRGLDAVKTEFTFKVRDRWGNYSDQKVVSLTPFFEQELVGKNIFERWGYDDQSCIYRGDNPTQAGSSSRYSFSQLWDGITIEKNEYYFHTGDIGNRLSLYSENYKNKNDVVGPVYVTIDMKEPHYLSRMKMWMRGRDPGQGYLLPDHRYYQQGDIKNYEIWACKEPKTINEIGDKAKNLAYWTSWNEVDGTDAWKKDWVKLGEMAALPPSGAKAVTQLTVNDIKFADEGFDTVFDPLVSDQMFRYVRIVVKDSWGGVGSKVTITELRFWGQF